jgi:hypothetical protein
MAKFESVVGVAGVVESLWELAQHMGVGSNQLEQLEAVLEVITAVECEAGHDAAAGATLRRFRGQYAQLRTWARSGRRDKVQDAFEKLLAVVDK